MTAADLKAAVPTLETWLDLRSTLQWLASRERAVEVMLGYSDSAEDQPVVGCCCRPPS